MHTPTHTRLGRLIKRVSELGVPEKLCPCCQQWKPHDNWHYQYIATRGHMRSECRKCFSAKQMARIKRRAA